MEKYILELIKEHNRIIVPNFGAFIISREKGQTILFNSFLSFNDGLLINQVSKTDNIDLNEATQKVNEFVNAANSTLDQKGVFMMVELGTFTKDQTGILRFMQKEQENVNNSVIPPQKTARKANSSDLLDIDTTTSLKEDVVEEVAKPVKPSNEKLLVIDPPIPVGTYAKNIPPKVEKKVIAKPDAPKKAIEENRKKLKKGLPVWLLIALITLPIILVLLYFLFFKDGFRLFKAKTPPPIEQLIIPQPEQPIVEVVPELPKPAITTRQHHIIVGSFKNEAKANELFTSLKNKGLTNASIISQQGQFMVSADWDASLNKAFERQEELLKELNMENWIITLK